MNSWFNFPVSIRIIVRGTRLYGFVLSLGVLGCIVHGVDVVNPSRVAAGGFAAPVAPGTQSWPARCQAAVLE
jgi:hypothetical protein